MPAKLRVDSHSIVVFLRLLADELEAGNTSILAYDFHDWSPLGKKQLSISWAVDREGNPIS